jgi:hypothetical protein
LFARIIAQANHFANKKSHNFAKFFFVHDCGNLAKKAGVFFSEVFAWTEARGVPGKRNKLFR